MKNLMKKNLVFVFALFVATTTMSFKLAEQRNADDFWFEVGTDGESIGSLTSAPSVSDACRHPNPNDICKVNLNTSTPPETVSDAIGDGSYQGSVSRTP